MRRTHSYLRSHAHRQAELANPWGYVRAAHDMIQDSRSNILAGELKDHEVYSCHVSPDGKRIVSAGGGELASIPSRYLTIPFNTHIAFTDGHVRIWSIEALHKSKDASFTGPKQLAAISNHSGTIHAVRFSSNNKYLASGADDKIVCVYTLDPNPPSHGSTFGTIHVPQVLEKAHAEIRL
jgi:protein HIRA/HIR1